MPPVKDRVHGLIVNLFDLAKSVSWKYRRFQEHFKVSDHPLVITLLKPHGFSYKKGDDQTLDFYESR